VVCVTFVFLGALKEEGDTEQHRRGILIPGLLKMACDGNDVGAKCTTTLIRTLWSGTTNGGSGNGEIEA
jgi:hypothetical protein